MLKKLSSIAATAIMIAAITTSTVQAKQIDADTPKTELSVTQQKIAKAQSPYFWLVLGVGY
jgi:hypothetical protein